MPEKTKQTEKLPKDSKFGEFEESCWYCHQPAVVKVACATVSGAETNPRPVCAGCRERHEF